MKNIGSSIPVNPQYRRLNQHRDWGRLGCEAAQERMDPSPLPKVGRKEIPIGTCQSKPGRQSPEKMVGESASFEDLHHQQRRSTAPGVSHGIRHLARPTEVGVGGGDIGGQRNRGQQDQCLGSAGFSRALP